MTTTTNDVIRLTMPDRRVYEIPVQFIAEHRAKHYAGEFEGSLNRSLEEDTLPYFAEDDYNVIDWAQNNMNWCDVVLKARIVNDLTQPSPDEMQNAWCNSGDITVWRTKA
jgi:hypothetical protein